MDIVNLSIKTSASNLQNLVNISLMKNMINSQEKSAEVFTEIIKQATPPQQPQAPDKTTFDISI